MAQSEISTDLIATYRTADYRVECGIAAFTLHIDQYSEPLARLFAASAHQCAVFITACNPCSQPQSLEVNRAVQTRLRDELSCLTDQVIVGTGSDPAGAWPVEESFLALGVDLAAAMVLGRQFGQNAIVWVGADAIPRLILLR